MYDQAESEHNPEYKRLISIRLISSYIRRHNHTVIKIPRMYIAVEYKNIYKSINLKVISK